MKDTTVFTTQNVSDLKLTCERIISLLNENHDGQLMAIQLILLGDNVKSFVDNPIIKNSGIL